MSLLPTFERSLHLRHDRLALDFTNTVGNHASAEPSEGLPTYADFIAWAERLGLLPAAAVERLRAEAERQPAAAETVRSQAVELREAIYRLLLAHVRGEAVEPADLLRLNQHLREALAYAALTPDGESYALQWDLADSDALG